MVLVLKCLKWLYCEDQMITDNDVCCLFICSQAFSAEVKDLFVKHIKKIEYSMN